MATHSNTWQHTAPQCNALQHTATHCNQKQKGTWATPVAATHCSTLQHTATLDNTRQYTAIHCNTLAWGYLSDARHCNTLQHSAPHCTTLQHTAPHCNTLQHTATRSRRVLERLPSLQQCHVACNSGSVQSLCVTRGLGVYKLEVSEDVATLFPSNFSFLCVARWLGVRGQGLGFKGQKNVACNSDSV